jgi:DNA-binding NarL/FixJ family response regulator
MNPDKTPIRIVLVDSQRLALDALPAALAAHGDLAVVGTATTGDAGRALIRRTRPDVALLELEVSGLSTLAIAEELARDGFETKPVLLTTHLSDILLSHALRIGIRGYLLKSDAIDALVQSIRRIHAGKTWYSREVEDRLTYDRDAGRYVVRTESPLSVLTDRQLEVLRYLGRGESVRSVAETLRLSIKSIESHKYRIMEKLEIHDRVELALYAIREGLVLP